MPSTRACPGRVRTPCGRCGDFGATLRKFNDQDEHAHALAGYPRKAAVPALVTSLKGVPARELRSEATGQVNGHITLPIAALPRRALRRCAAEHHPAMYRAANNAGQRNFRANPALKDEACARQFRSGQLPSPATGLNAGPGR